MLYVAHALPSLGETFLCIPSKCKKQLSDYVSMQVLLFIITHVEGDSTFPDQSVNASPRCDQWKKIFCALLFGTV